VRGHDDTIAFQPADPQATLFVNQVNRRGTAALAVPLPDCDNRPSGEQGQEAEAGSGQAARPRSEARSAHPVPGDAAGAGIW